MLLTKNISMLLVLILTGILLGGCDDSPREFAVNKHFLSSNEDVFDLSRVVFVELSDDTGNPRQAWSMTLELQKFLQDKDFHTDCVRANDARCVDLPLRQLSALSLEQLNMMRKDLQCDAILFGRLTHFQPYPKLQIGVYAKLINLRDGKTVWAIDRVWDTTQRDTEDRIKYFVDLHMRTGYGPGKGRLALISPRMMQTYVAWEIARTIPSRNEVYKQQRDASMKRESSFIGKNLKKVVRFAGKTLSSSEGRRQ